MHEQQNEKPEKPLGAAGHAIIGAGVGAAGVGNSIGLIGLSTGLAALPFSIGIGLIGGLVWWAVRTAARKL